MSPARSLLLSVCGALAARRAIRPAVRQGEHIVEPGVVDPKTLGNWDDASWKEPCWGTPDPLQQLNGEVLESICARLHMNASFLVFGLGRDSGLWYNNSPSKKVVFLENHKDWLQFQEEDVRAATRIVQYTSDATAYKQDLQDESKLVALFESLPRDVKEAHWDMILVDSPMGMEEPSVLLTLAKYAMSGFQHYERVMRPRTGTPGRTQSIYAARRLAQEHTIIYVDDVHRTVENESARVLLRPNYQSLQLFPSGHADENGIMGQTSMLIHRR